METCDRALVLGLGVSGESAALLLLDEGSRVTVVDAADNPGLRSKAEAVSARGAKVLIGTERLPAGEFDICVLSPGIASDSDWVREIGKRGTKIVSELQLGWARCGSPTVAVTGSNGKSTFVKLCVESLQNAGRRAVGAGNYGLPLSAVARKKENETDWIVAEVSSFQMEKTGQFKPRVGVLLNIQADHLDRHGGEEVYAGLKRKMFRQMGSGDTAVVPVEEKEAVKRTGSGAEQWATFGISERADFRYRKGAIEIRNKWSGVTGTDMVPVNAGVFDNEVFGPGYAAVVAAVCACGERIRNVASAAEKFTALPHRRQDAGETGGVRFVDDSKATNLSAMEASLKAESGNATRLIAGGLLKGQNPDGVTELLSRTVKKVYLIGTSAPAMEAAWGRSVPCRRCADLDEAVKTAYSEAEKGETVLLAPGCASFDEFSGFEERGDEFEKIVKEISEGKHN
ncbi:MAG: UDP-N-acetylmuramoyl-L-alanine--D-glutamate ligase [Kiritimatiellia bacterium]